LLVDLKRSRHTLPQFPRHGGGLYSKARSQHPAYAPVLSQQALTDRRSTCKDFSCVVVMDELDSAAVRGKISLVCSKESHT